MTGPVLVRQPALESSGDDRATILTVERDRTVRELQLLFLNNAGFIVEFNDLAASKEIFINTGPEYVIGYLCRELMAKKLIPPNDMPR